MKIGMAMMGAKAFLDTNILLRAFHDTFPEHPRVRAVVDQLMDEEAELWISRQVIREYLVQATHPATFNPPLTVEPVKGQLREILTFVSVADDTHADTNKLLALLDSHPTLGKQVHDANIVATMLVNNIDVLVTLNVDDMKRFQNRISVMTPPVQDA